jgi:hypothetical protein
MSRRTETSKQILLFTSLHFISSTPTDLLIIHASFVALSNSMMNNKPPILGPRVFDIDNIPVNVCQECADRRWLDVRRHSPELRNLRKLTHSVAV